MIGNIMQINYQKNIRTKKNNYLVSGLKMYNHQKYWGLILKSSLLILFVIMRSNFLDNTITDSLCNMILPRVVALVSSIDISASLTARFNGWLSLVAAAFRVQLQRSQFGCIAQQRAWKSFSSLCHSFFLCFSRARDLSSADARG